MSLHFVVDCRDALQRVRRIVEVSIPELAHLSDARCVIHHTRNSHRILVLHVYRTHHNLICKLVFFIPIYLEMPFDWENAAFEIAQDSELEEHWQKIWSHRLSKEDFLRLYRLYKVKFAENNGVSNYVKIVALDLKIVMQ
jgi:hypothetical protein